jgi:hypothetical protein
VKSESSKGRAGLAALGFRAHSGWATLVVAAVQQGSFVVLERRRIELKDPNLPAQPYHTAEGSDPAIAEAIVQHSVECARRLACATFRRVAEDLRNARYELVGSGLLRASGRALPPLADVLRSHALIHAAEGELFRDALVYASNQCGLAVTAVKERDLYAVASTALGIREDALNREIAQIGRLLGPPWRADEKLASLVARLVLA